MKTNLLTIAATLLLAVSANSAFADDTFYLSGTFNKWGNQNNGGSPNVAFTFENGEYTLSYKFEGEFKIVKNNEVWYGYGKDVAYTTISNDNPLTLYTENANLYLGFPTTYKLTVKIVDNKPQLTVTGFPEEGLYLLGDFNGWVPEILTTNSDGSYTITKENVSGGNEFKFRDADGTWYGGNSNDNTYNIKNEWRSYMSIASPGKNFKFEGTPGTCTFVITEGNKLTVFGYGENLVSLSDNGGNNLSTSSNGVDVVINGRTLYGGEWNTLCLPFNVYDGNNEDGISFSGTVLQGASVKTLSSSSFEDGSLTLNFSDASTIEAGVPYIVKVNSNIVNPKFTNVTISATTPGQSGESSDKVIFQGCFDATEITGSNNLYLGAANTLYYPSQSVTIKAFRAYFKLNLPSGQHAKSFVLNFDDDNEVTSIKQINNAASATDTYFTLDGRRLNDKPSTPGLYIINGKKVVIK